MMKQNNKMYHENDLCHIFLKVFHKLMQAHGGKRVIMENEDVCFPLSEEVDNEEVFTAFKNAQSKIIIRVMRRGMSELTFTFPTKGFNQAVKLINSCA